MSPTLSRILAYALFAWLGAFTFVGLDRPVGDGDECRHAMVLRQMVQGGQYLRPMLEGAGYLDPSAQVQTAHSSITRPLPVVFERPLLPYWLAAPFASVIPGEIGARLSSALASFATLIVVFFAARSFWKRGDAAFVATLLLAGSPGFHAYSRTLMSEPPLVLGLTIAVTSAVAMRADPRFLIGAALGLGFGVACKSLVVAVPALLLAPWLLHCAFTRADGRTRLLALAAFLATALPYYVLGVALHGAAFIDAHFPSLGDRVVQRGGVGLPGGAFAYLLWIREIEGVVALSWMTLGTVGAVAWGGYRRRPELILLGTFGLGVIGLMSLISIHLPHYILAAYPAAALAVGGMYAEVASRAGVERRRFAFLIGPVLAMLVLLEGRMHPGDVYLLPRPWGRELGLLAKRIVPRGQTLYAHEWKATSLGYYSERGVVLLTENARLFRVVAPFVKTMYLVPPAPAEVGSVLYVAGEAPTLSNSPWMKVEQVLGASPPMFLVRARVTPIEAQAPARTTPEAAPPSHTPAR